MVAVRCPRELAHIVQRAGGVWEPGSRRWLVDERCVRPLIVRLRRRPIRCSAVLASSWSNGRRGKKEAPDIPGLS